MGEWKYGGIEVWVHVHGVWRACACMYIHALCIYPCREVLLAGEPYDNLATPYNMLRGLKAIGVTDNLDVVRLRVIHVYV